jgi:hypothetical protein
MKLSHFRHPLDVLGNEATVKKPSAVASPWRSEQKSRLLLAGQKRRRRLLALEKADYEGQWF